MENLSLVLYGAMIGFFVREILAFSIQCICEQVVKWRCKKLPEPERSEIIDGMIADLKTERLAIGMLKIALTGHLDNTRPPTIQKEDKEQ